MINIGFPLKVEPFAVTIDFKNNSEYKPSRESIKVDF